MISFTSSLFIRSLRFTSENAFGQLPAHLSKRKYLSIQILPFYTALRYNFFRFCSRTFRIHLPAVLFCGTAARNFAFSHYAGIFDTFLKTLEIATLTNSICLAASARRKNESRNYCEKTAFTQAALPDTREREECSRKRTRPINETWGEEGGDTRGASCRGGETRGPVIKPYPLRCSRDTWAPIKSFDFYSAVTSIASSRETKNCGTPLAFAGVCVSRRRAGEERGFLTTFIGIPSHVDDAVSCHQSAKLASQNLRGES